MEPKPKRKGKGGQPPKYYNGVNRTLHIEQQNQIIMKTLTRPGGPYKIPAMKKTSMDINTSVEGETIETKIERVLNNKEPIKDLTTYIDPTKFNHIFADTRRDAQNFWAQIGVDMTVRRKMSAKIMPNL